MSIKYSDSGFLDGADETKKLSFDVSGVTTGTTRTITMPDGDTKLYTGDGTSGQILTSGGTGVAPTFQTAAGATGMDDVSGVARATSGLLFNADTADANKLDDYEEGTWTPNQGSLNVVGTFSSSGKYTKIGNLVHIEGKVSGTTSVALTGTDKDISTNNPFTPTGSMRASGLAINQSIGASAGFSVIPGTGRLITAETMAATANIYFSTTYSV